MKHLKKHYTIEYEVLYDSEYECLSFMSEYEDDEIKEMAHNEAHSEAVKRAGCMATDIANAVLKERCK